MSGGFTRISNVLLDCHLADLTGGEIKTYLYVNRRTAGFQKASDDISVSQICNGIRKHDGTVLDRGTGLSRETVITALAGLQQKGLVVRTPGAGTIPDSYTIVELEQSENPTDSGRKIRPVASRKTRPLSGRKTRNTIERGKSSSRERGKERNPGAAVEGSTIAEPRSENLKLVSDSSKTDDEKPKRRTPLENPEMEFRARMAERHGPTVDAEALLAHVKGELCDVPLSRFLEADLTATTAPGRLSNPHGHYRILVRNLGRQGFMSVLDSITQTSEAARKFVTVKDTWQPPTCCKDGLLAGGAYCACKVGEARRQLGEFTAKQAAGQ